MATKTVVVGVTASIALYKACDLVRRLQDRSYNVKVVMTAEAEQLIRPALFQNLSGNKVAGRLFEDAQEWEIEHVALAQAADVVVIAPATAQIIAKVNAGICDDMLTCVVCATEAPVLFCPAMNDGMFHNKIVRENIARLKSLGYIFVGPREGRLACGKKGVGCLAEVDTIVKEVARHTRK